MEAEQPAAKKARQSSSGKDSNKAGKSKGNAGTDAEEEDRLASVLGEWQDELEASARAPETGDVVLDTLRRELRYDAFRGQQEWVVRRVLAGQSTLMVAPTGSGKSLTYQLPALLLRRNLGTTTKGSSRKTRAGITVVVSPLVSLMEDQMAKLPPPLCGVALTGRQPAKAIAETLASLRDGAVHVMFVSPERLLSPAFARLMRSGTAAPHVSLVCIDEAHCVTEWGHDFRPAYLRLRSACTHIFGDAPLLALTATATPTAVSGVQSVLGIPAEGVCLAGWHRPNLRLTASSEEGDARARALVDMMTDPASPLGPTRPRQVRSGMPKQADPAKGPCVIVYTSTQKEAEIAADLLKQSGVPAAAYHAGMSDKARNATQQRFMFGSLRVVCATVAFGMGIDKSDVRGVVHIGAPRSVEDYVQ